MDSQTQALVDAVVAREKGAEKRLREHLRSQEAALPPLLAELSRHGDPHVRIVVIRAARDLNDPEVLATMERLAEDANEQVRGVLAGELADFPGWELEVAIRLLLQDSAENVRANAARAAGVRTGLFDILREALTADDGQGVRRNAARALRRDRAEEALPRLLDAVANDDAAVVRETAAHSAESLMRDLGDYPPDTEVPAYETLHAANSRVQEMKESLCPTVRDWLAGLLAGSVDPAALAQFGTDLTALAEQGKLVRAHEVDEIVEALVSLLDREGKHASILLGEPGTGKSAIVQELVHRLREPEEGPPWRVLRISPSEFLVGTMYLGEWETKLKRLVEEARWPRRVLIYIPGIQELTSVGRSSVSQANIATMLAPHIESGTIAVLGESTPEEFESGMGRSGSIRRLFETVEVPPADPARTRRIVTSVAADLGADWTSEQIDRFLELSELHFTGSAQPGRAVGLLRRFLEAAPGTPEEFNERSVLETISVSTGIPVALLDDAAPLDLPEMRRFFESRVMGQGEAVDSVLDLITLIKAGLTDPEKPFGVLFFVGPTGVGKTELARCLAEFTFGDPGSLLRFDMSEFATYDAFERLIGKGDTQGLLTSAMRERPLGVILLDEIEKAHVNVFDLCLQIFDAGRLTDGRGRTADFRRTIIILTSNVGSVVPLEDSFGFAREVRPPPDRETTLRKVHEFFRPEFLNRLDRIVVFKPLSPQTAEKIARRELGIVVERSGIARRSLSVNVDPSVISLLLKVGYSPAFGARPLKRTIERLVMMPVARAIASGRAAPGSVLNLAARGQHVEVQLSAPEGEPPPKPKATRKAAKIEERLKELESRREGYDAFVALTAQNRSEALQQTAQPGFWSDRESALETMEKIRRFDGLISEIEALGRRIRGLRDSARSDPAHVGEILDRLEKEADRVEFLAFRCGPADLSDALVTVSLMQATGPGLDGVARIAGMYAAFARGRGFDVEVIDDRRGGEPPEDTITIAVEGVGAFGILSGETGLHNVLRTVGGKNRPVRERDVVRVEVLALPHRVDRPSAEEVRVETSPVRGQKGRLGEKPKTEVSVLHLGTMASLRAWTPAGPEEALDRVLPLFLARRDRASEKGSLREDTVVRRYTLGPTPRVRDQRTGRTGRLESVLEGDLELFLTPRE